MRFASNNVWGRFSIWLFINTMSEVSNETSVPAPIATPTSAVANAGASLMPSPIIKTLPKSFCRVLILFTLSSGIQLAS